MSSWLKKLQATIWIVLLYPMLLVVSSCMENEFYIEGCPLPTPADATGIAQVFYSPYVNQRYSSTLDTVPFQDFRFNLELKVMEKERADAGFLPGKAFALSCMKSYSISNISNISVILLQPFAGLPIGTDIGYLLETPEGQKISEIREFQAVQVYFGMKLNITPENYSRLKTRTFLFLKDGSRHSMDSTSPYLRSS
ncbi:MAG: hypothetical protein LPK25_15575 [Cyclobacteriaceae bacterium]|nr:hypothetical protein [Cyclobacteriaceae bacterium]MDX5467829.1 hypothetical protein [Cyclobacteriaceae bacterium]